VANILPLLRSLPLSSAVDNTNPLEQLLRLVNQKREQKWKEYTDTLAAEAQKSVDSTKNLPLSADHSRDSGSAANPASETEPSKNNTAPALQTARVTQRMSREVSSFKKFFILMNRSFRDNLRDKRLFVLYFVQSFSEVIIYLIIFHSLNRDYPSYTMPPTLSQLSNLQSRIGSLFALTIGCYVSPLFNSTLRMSKEARVVYKEISGGLYPRWAYFWSKSILDLMFILPVIFINMLIVGIL
jgi:hypothetical protein